MYKKSLYFIFAGLLVLGAGCVDTATVPPSNDAPRATAPAPAPAPAPVSVNKLDLSGKGLEKISMSVFDMTGLEELDVSHNRLTGALPSQIQRLRNLRVLDASDNDMTGVPAEIGQLSNLTQIDLSNNRLTGLPFELGNLVSLRRLDLRGNDVSKQDLDAIRLKLKGTEILE